MSAQCSCFQCGIRATLRTAFNTAAGLFTTSKGQLEPGPMYSDQIAPAYAQPHKKRDGIPWSGLVPTMRINAPAQPDLILNPNLFQTLYLRALPHAVDAPRRNIKTVVNKGAGAQNHWWGRSG